MFLMVMELWFESWWLIFMESSSRKSSFKFLGVLSFWKGMSLCTKKATPPPLSFSLSFLTSVKLGVIGVLDFALSFVSCIAAILMLNFSMWWMSSLILLPMPLMFICKMLKL